MNTIKTIIAFAFVLVAKIIMGIFDFVEDNVGVSIIITSILIGLCFYFF